MMSYLDQDIKEEENLIEEMVSDTSSSKILFLGLTQTGKTSIIKTVFEGRAPEDTEDLVATVRFERMKYNYNDHKIFTYDVGGQISYLEEAIEVSKQEIFANVKALIFVIEAVNLGAYASSRQYLLRALRNVYQYSDDPRVYVFAHKMDLITEDNRDDAMRVFKQYLDLDKLENVVLFQTSIYDNSTIEAMEKILNN